MNGKFVFAKHDGVDKEYCFAVPDGMDINIGDKLLVETCRGNQVVTATSTELFSSQYDQIVKRFGATIPLKRVLQCCGKKMQDYFQKQAENAIINDIIKQQLKRAASSDPIPFDY